MDLFSGLSPDASKTEASHLILSALTEAGFPVIEMNAAKPWGIEFKIDLARSKRFLETFFDGDLPDAVAREPFGPKILAIQGPHRLSWHVHERKDAFLRVLRGEVDVYASPTDKQPAPRVESVGSVIHIPELVRHRLGGRRGWTILAEISRNVFLDHPSDDDDERRISDDYGRT